MHDGDRDVMLEHPVVNDPVVSAPDAPAARVVLSHGDVDPAYAVKDGVECERVLVFLSLCRVRAAGPRVVVVVPWAVSR